MPRWIEHNGVYFTHFNVWGGLGVSLLLGFTVGSGLAFVYIKVRQWKQ